jgi:hypothetical protein
LKFIFSIHVAYDVVLDHFTRRIFRLLHFVSCFASQECIVMAIRDHENVYGKFGPSSMDAEISGVLLQKDCGNVKMKLPKPMTLGHGLKLGSSNSLT